MAAIIPSRERISQGICSDFVESEQREWLVTNNLGSYAMGTLAGTLTRRYHGLLNANINGPLGRHMVLSKAETTLMLGEQEIPLFTNRWKAINSQDTIVEPQGYQHITGFELDGRMPVWHYEMDQVRLEMRIWMEPHANITYIAYRLDPDSAYEGTVKLKSELLINSRDHHQNCFSKSFTTILNTEGNTLNVKVPELYNLKLTAVGGEIYKDGTWRENFYLKEEEDRGLPTLDNHLCAGNAILELVPGQWVGVVASLEEDYSTDIRAALNRFRSRDIEILKRARRHVPETAEAPEWIDRLMVATDSFIFSRQLGEVRGGESVIAGYPWFGDWGRDTMISFSGLTLATGRFDSARRILNTAAKFVDKGMLPNVFPGDGSTPQYNSVDAALWYIEAWRAYMKVTQDIRSLKNVFPILQKIILWYIKGTRYGIVLDPNDGLLYAGTSGMQLTWMDAKVGDEVVTPRIGKAVEVNALWFNAVNSMTRFCYQLGYNPETYGNLVKKSLHGFQRFIKPNGGGLYDVIDGPAGNDESVRPNQILAVSLPYSALDKDAQAQVVHICARELLTAYGLRTLSPYDARYQARYKGNVMQRDAAYHQGSVWAWLLGHYALAEYRVHGDPLAAQSRLDAIKDHLNTCGMGMVSELFDGTEPHIPRGAPAQAWSVAAILEAWWKLERAKRNGIKNKTSSMSNTNLERVFTPIVHS